MPQMDQSPQNKFIKEKIKERPVNKKKLIQRTLITAAMAVMFGLIACFTFLILEPVISNWLYPEEEPQVVLFPEEQEEMSPEEMLSNTMQEQEPVPEPITEVNMALEKEQIQEILSGVVCDKDSYREIYSALLNYANDLSHSIVTVNCISSDVDWLNNVMENSKQAWGAIIANNEKELLILTDYSMVKNAEKLIVVFYNKVQSQANLKQFDENTGLAVLAVDLAGFTPEFRESIKIASFGSSNTKNILGIPVIALGSPMGSCGSIGYGIIAGESRISSVDSSYKLLQTDIYGSQSAGGVLFNLQNQIIGVITRSKNGSDMKNLITAYGISDLRKIIEKMSNGISAAFLGITGMDISSDVNSRLGVPYGAYVKEVAKDSPAMMTGIQPGDVIISIGERTIDNYGEYVTALLGMEAGETVDVTLMRQAQQEYKEMTLNITLGKSGKEE